MFEKKRQTIMLVDDNPVNLNIGKNMLKDFYEVYALPSVERLFKFLEAILPDLILLDIEMPNMNGFDALRILSANERYKDIPVIFVTGKSEELSELEGLNLGAVDYVTKPFSTPILLKRIETHLLIKKQKAELENLNENLIKMVKEKTAQVVRLQGAIINAIAEIVEFRDAFTGGHIMRTQEYMRILIDQLVESGVYSDEVIKWENSEFILPATQLHDLGKIFIEDAILNKPGKLTPEEFEIMKSHVVKGTELIKRMKEKGEEQPFLKYAKIIAATHHERWDGSGYPSGLKGCEIPLLGRLMAIADVYDALVSPRSYKTPFSTEKSAEIIIEGAGTHFDPTLIDAFKIIQHKFAAIALIS